MCHHGTRNIRFDAYRLMRCVLNTNDSLITDDDDDGDDGGDGGGGGGDDDDDDNDEYEM